MEALTNEEIEAMRRLVAHMEMQHGRNRHPVVAILSCVLGLVITGEHEEINRMADEATEHAKYMLSKGR